MRHQFYAGGRPERRELVASLGSGVGGQESGADPFPGAGRKEEGLRAQGQ